MAENVDLIVQLTGIVGGSIAFLRFLDYHYKSKLSKDTRVNTNSYDIEHLETQLREISDELSNTRGELFEKMAKHEDFADDVIRELKADIIKLIHDLASLEGQFKVYKELHGHDE